MQKITAKAKGSSGRRETTANYFIEQAPKGLRPRAKGKDRYESYSPGDPVIPKFSLTGLIYWYSQSKFAGELDAKYTFRLVRPNDMGVPWLTQFEDRLEKILVTQAELACRTPIKLKRKLQTEFINDSLCSFLFFTHEGRLPFITATGQRGDAEPEDLPNLTPIRLTGYIRQDLSPFKDEIQARLIPMAVRILKKTPPVLAPLERHIRRGPDPEYPEDELEAPDGEDMPVDENLDGLFAAPVKPAPESRGVSF